MPLVVPCLPVYRKCCCISVRTGSIILAWMSMILFMISFVILHKGIYENKVAENEYEDRTSLWNSDDPEKWKTVARHRNLSYFVDFNMNLGMILLVVDGVFSGLLLYGIHYRKPSFMVPMLTMSVVTVAFSILITVYYFILALYGSFLFEIPDMPQLQYIFRTMLVVTGVLIPVEAVVLYLWNIVYSHYRELETSLQTDQYGKLMETKA